MVSTRRQAALGQSSTSMHASLPQDSSHSPVSSTTSNGLSQGMYAHTAGLERSRRVKLTLTSDSTTLTTSASETNLGSSVDPQVAGGAKGTATPKRPQKRRKGKWSANMKKVALLAREAKKSLLRNFLQLPLDIILEVS
jgi:hypothetical protein